MHTSLFKQIIEKIVNKDERACRICSDNVCNIDDKWIKPCGCKGSILWVHHNCLKKWMEYSNGTKCTTCGNNYKISKLNTNNSLLSRILFNYKFIYILSIYLLGVIYFTLFKLSMTLNQKYKGYFFNWFYVIRGICILSILFYIGFYFLCNFFNKKLVEDVQTPNLILDVDNIFISSLFVIPLDIYKIFIHIFQKEEELSQIEILDY